MSFGNEREFIDEQQSKEKGSRAMKCPLFALGILAYRGTDKGALYDCLKEECAWWDRENEDCAIFGVMSCLEAIGGVLTEIKDKMPQPRQFVK